MKHHAQAGQAFAIGLLFGVGLLLSGMSNPQKVIGFLDLAGAWDPSLVMVMGGAIAVGLPLFRLAESRSHRQLPSWSGAPIHLPGKSGITPRLVLGSVLFGIGWGIAGICPGPGLVLVGSLQWPGLLFVLAMVAGMLLFRPLDKALSR